MVATRKSNTVATSYSQSTAEDVWIAIAEREREEEAAAAAAAKTAESEASFPPLSMADGGHLHLQLGDDGEEEQVEEEASDEASVEFIMDRDPDCPRFRSQIDNPSLLMPEEDTTSVNHLHYPRLHRRLLQFSLKEPKKLSAFLLPSLLQLQEKSKHNLRSNDGAIITLDSTSRRKRNRKKNESPVG